MTKYNLSRHSHGDHVHFNLIRIKSDHAHSHVEHEDLDSHPGHDEHDGHCEPCEVVDSTSIKQIGKNNEGCPCCMNMLDLDEIIIGMVELLKNSGGNLEAHKDSLGRLADFSSDTHWGIFLGIAGPLSLLGLTAAFRNIKGTRINQSNLDAVSKIVETVITQHKGLIMDSKTAKEKEDLSGVIQRLEAFRDTLKYSKFDTKFNLAVPGVINGAASTMVLSSAIVSSPWALPVIALYAGCQTVRNGYDLWRIWNKILPEEARKEVQLNVKVGVRKINQITDSKRKFYAANTLGFAAFTAGAVITTLSALSVVGAPGAIPGIALLAAGAVSTGITNNIWTNQFKPRNSDLGIKREQLDLNTIKKEIGERREVKKLLKNYIDKHLPTKLGKRFGCSLLSSLPFGNEKGQKLLHRVNQSRISESDSDDRDRLDLLERAINVRKLLKTDNSPAADALLKKISGLEEISVTEKATFGLVSFNQGGSVCEQIFKNCQELEIDTMVLDRFIKNAILESSDEHDSSIKDQKGYFDKLVESGLFTINGDDVTFNLEALETNQDMKKAFMNSLEECLLFDYVEKLKYEQYGLNDFYWALEKQNKKQAHSHVHQHDHHREHSHEDHSPSSHAYPAEQHHEHHEDHEDHAHSHPFNNTKSMGGRLMYLPPAASSSTEFPTGNLQQPRSQSLMLTKESSLNIR